MIPIHKVECTVSLLAIKILFLSLLSFDFKKKINRTSSTITYQLQGSQIGFFLFSNNKSGMNHSF